MFLQVISVSIAKFDTSYATHGVVLAVFLAVGRGILDVGRWI